jgi:hypothetical protein
LHNDSSTNDMISHTSSKQSVLQHSQMSLGPTTMSLGLQVAARECDAYQDGSEYARMCLVEYNGVFSMSPTSRESQCNSNSDM